MNLSDFATQPQHPDTLRQLLDAILTRRNYSALLGAGVGGGAGLIGSYAHKGKDGKSHALRNTLLGAGVGGLGAYGLAGAFPEQNKAFTKPLIENTIQKPIGRVVTNIVDPRNYSDHANDFAAAVQHPYEAIKSIVTDKPLYRTPYHTPNVPENLYLEREAPYRRMFHLQPRDGAGDVYTTQPNGDMSFNPANPIGHKLIQEIKDQVDTPNKFDAMGHNPVYSSVSGHYNRRIDPINNTVTHWQPWQVKLNPAEHITTQNGMVDRVNLMRYLMNKVTNPPMIRGTIPLDRPLANPTPPPTFTAPNFEPTKMSLGAGLNVPNMGAVVRL